MSLILLKPRTGLSSSSGVSTEVPSGSVNGLNTIFTVTAEPKWVVSDGVVYFNSNGYTYGALTITMDIPPSQYIRAIL